MAEAENQYQDQTLSSSGTWAWKLAMPVINIWIVGSILSGGVWGKGIRSEDRMEFATVLLVGLVFSLYFGLRVKFVELRGSQLRVSDFIEDRLIPLTSIIDVQVRSFFGPRRIKLTLDESAGFGKHIIFLPALKWGPLFGPNPIAKLLQDRIDKELEAQRRASN